MKNFFIAFLFLSLIGLGVSGYLWYEYSQPEPIVCTTDCEKVRNSEYSSMLGISLPIWGFAFYVALVVYSLKKLFFDTKIFFEENLVFAYLFSGFIFSMYLTFLEAFVIDAWCQWCIISAIVSTLLFILYSGYFYKEQQKKQ